MTKGPGPVKKLNLVMLTALVTGNMIGSGIFLLPANLATIGSISLLSWLFTATGAFLLAMVFAKMSGLVRKTGGPYAYARAGFGRYIGFQTAYNYWVALWSGNAAIVIAAVGYLKVFWPQLANPVIACATAIGFIWLLTWVNLRGVHQAGSLSVAATALKLIPILLVAIFGWLYFHPEYLSESFNVSGSSNISAFSNSATLTLWAFIGLESATVPSGSVENPERNIPIATLLGVIITAIAYITSSAAIMGMIPAKDLAMSTSPFAAAANIIFGPWGNWFIAAGATISCLGCLNGWIMLQGQVAMAAAQDGLFPKIFAERNLRQVPAWGLIITSVLITLLLLITSSPNLVQQFKIIILIATLSSLIPYLFTSVTEMMLVIPQMKQSMTNRFHFIIAFLAMFYSLWAIYGSGINTIFYGTILVFSSVPLYAWVLWQNDALPQIKDEDSANHLQK